MKYWEIFWTFSLLLSGTAFLLITIVVIVRGGPDLRDMLRQLGREHVPPEDTPDTRGSA
ncbi:MAG TPA: hypothetical protein VEJ67_14295 [Candidatus Cybelea sp.]|nr:hypothetical protein [Candidatus Cybelea sp.]